MDGCYIGTHLGMRRHCNTATVEQMCRWGTGDLEQGGALDG